MLERCPAFPRACYRKAGRHAFCTLCLLLPPLCCPDPTHPPAGVPGPDPSAASPTTTPASTSHPPPLPPPKPTCRKASSRYSCCPGLSTNASTRASSLSRTLLRTCGSGGEHGQAGRQAGRWVCRRSGGSRRRGSGGWWRVTAGGRPGRRRPSRAPALAPPTCLVAPLRQLAHVQRALEAALAAPPLGGQAQHARLAGGLGQAAPHARARRRRRLAFRDLWDCGGAGRKMRGALQPARQAPLPTDHRRRRLRAPLPGAPRRPPARAARWRRSSRPPGLAARLWKPSYCPGASADQSSRLVRSRTHGWPVLGNIGRSRMLDRGSERGTEVPWGTVAVAPRQMQRAGRMPAPDRICHTLPSRNGAAGGRGTAAGAHAWGSCSATALPAR